MREDDVGQTRPDERRMTPSGGAAQAGRAGQGTTGTIDLLGEMSRAALIARPG
jgi:hypothetical protein